MSIQPEIVLRIGSHAEKEYFEKLAPALDAIMFGGNLLEITPAATASLLHALKSKRRGRAIPFYLDPITYCFGPYVDNNSKTRYDLDPLKSEQLVSRSGKTKHFVVKQSYALLAKELGDRFIQAVGDGKSSTAIDLSFDDDDVLDDICRGVADYQWNRVTNILSAEIALQGIANETRPAAIFAPYFFISHRWLESGIKEASDLVRRTRAYETRAPVHAIVCGCIELLTDEAVTTLIEEMQATGAEAIWLWIDGLDEFTASTGQLRNLQRLVRELSQSMKVYNLHGGYFSLLLAHDGMRGISHGVGYGERKKVQQVIGAAAPLVRYYLPGIRMRVGVPDLEQALRRQLKITSAEEFFEKVCGCQICKGVISKSFDNISSFGDQRLTSPTSQRGTQTPASAKMCRYHFLLNRLAEPKLVSELEEDERADSIRGQAAIWESCPSLKSYLNIDSGDGGYIQRWAQVLESSDTE